MKKVFISLMIIFALLLTGCQKSYSQGDDKGFSDGVEQGYSEGDKVGYDVGFEKGREEGIAIGKSAGYKEGQQSTAAYKNGYDDGYATGVLEELDLSDEDVFDVIYEDMYYYILTESDTIADDVLSRHYEYFYDHFYDYFIDMFREEGMLKEDW